MIDVNVSISGVILYCDESILGIHLGNGYSIEKTYVDDFPFKDKITDGRGQLSIAYLGTVKSDENGKYLFCLKKDDKYQIHHPILAIPGIFSGDDLMCNDQLESYSQVESEFLHKVFSLLHVFKEGNIGTKEVFFRHSFSIGILKNTMNHTNDSVTKNITDSRVFSLSATEIQECNQFLTDYSGAEYTLLKNEIDEFVWGLEQADTATGFEQFTTALEMTLLGHNQQGKKEVLSKRVAVMLENTSTNITQVYTKMKDFYRFRSESLHEGNGQNISDVELHEMEAIVRRVLMKCLERCKVELAINSAITWPEVKAKIINDLKAKVTAELNAGTFVG